MENERQTPSEGLPPTDPVLRDDRAMRGEPVSPKEPVAPRDIDSEEVPVPPVHSDLPADVMHADEGNPFGAVGGSPFAPLDAPPDGGSQFSLRALFVTTAGFAALFAVLSALGVDELETLYAFGGAIVGAGLAMLLLVIWWAISGGPRSFRN